MLIRSSPWPLSRSLDPTSSARRSLHSSLRRLDLPHDPKPDGPEKPSNQTQISQPSIQPFDHSNPDPQTLDLGPSRTALPPIHAHPTSARSPPQAVGFQRGPAGNFSPSSVRPGPWHANNNFAPPPGNPAHTPPTHTAPPQFAPRAPYWQPQQPAQQFFPGPAYNPQMYPRYPAFHQQPPHNTPHVFAPNQTQFTRSPNHFAGPNLPIQHQAPFPSPAPAQDYRPGYFPPQYPAPSYSAPPMYNPPFAPNQHFPISRPPPPWSAPIGKGSPVGSADESLNSPLGARQRKTLQSAASFDFDFQDLSGADVLDRFAQNASSHGPSANVNQSSSMPPIAPAYHQMPSYGPSGQFARPPFGGARPQAPGWGNGVYGPSMNGQMPGNPNQVPGRPDWQATRGRPMAARGGRVGPTRGRGMAPRGPRVRGRGMLFASRPEPSLPPPPKSVLDANGAFGDEPIVLGSPQSTPRSRAAGLTAAGAGEATEASGSDYKMMEGLICSSSTPVMLPGVAKPLQFSPLDRTQLDTERPTVSSVRGETSRTETVRRAMELVSRNPSLRIGEKRQAVGVVEFLLMSREERVAKMQ